MTADQPAHADMVNAARRLRYDLPAHRGQQVTLEMLEWADSVLAMDAAVLTTLRAIWSPSARATTCSATSRC
ncbi:hypothetical protein [Streptomyces yunnanensis]|uniref:Protein-tyrosine phosphatase n=1 Tax=Streptomyces yunnanensis TaxID=156453 RepID=A0A9X8R019_9ACTN|nr:hypothetical protein [Streptomyces yunnanensis]SHN29579.1 protein-tyrosine phosphatase [Streptomyces yunnanensis]